MREQYNSITQGDWRLVVCCIMGQWTVWGWCLLFELIDADTINYQQEGNIVNKMQTISRTFVILCKTPILFCLDISY